MNIADAVGRLRRAEWLVRQETQELWSLLDGGSGRTRAVGGIVRDTLLGRMRLNADVDFATELLPQEVIERAGRAGIAAYPTGIEHGTITLRLGDLVTEVTTLREDVSTDGRHAVVRFGTDWARDASRRDFTLNALYAGPKGELFDPLDGIADCLGGRVRFIGDPAARIEEDRLRVYRFFRFSASHGGENFDAAGLEACGAAAGRLGAVSAERVGAEMKRMLGLPRVALTLRRMTECGVLHLGEAVLQALAAYEARATAPTAEARLALLLAEIDRGRLKSMWRLSNEDIAVAEAVLQAAALLKDQRLHEAAYRYPRVLAAGVDVAAALGSWDDATRQACGADLDALRVPEFPIGGDDLLRLGLQPGKPLGDELRRLETLWIRSGFKLDRRSLLARLHRRAD